MRRIVPIRHYHPDSARHRRRVRRSCVIVFDRRHVTASGQPSASDSQQRQEASAGDALSAAIAVSDGPSSGQAAATATSSIADPLHWFMEYPTRTIPPRGLLSEWLNQQDELSKLGVMLSTSIGGSRSHQAHS